MVCDIRVHVYKTMHTFLCTIHYCCFINYIYAAAVSEAAPPHSNYLGTKPYISPEQEKKEEYGNKVDVYALGIIYFEMNFPFVTGMERTKVITHALYTMHVVV